MCKRRFALAVTAGMLGLVLAACGGGDDEGSRDVSSPTTAAVGPQTTESFSGNPNSRYCQLARTYLEKSKQLSQSGGGPDALRTLYKDAERDIKAAVDAAPSEIKNDAKVVADGLTVLVAGFESANWDPTRVSPDAFNAISTPQFQTSASRVEAYTTQVCGAQR
jgi:hypothetical protein